MRLIPLCIAAALAGAAAPASAAIDTVFTFVSDPFKDTDVLNMPGRQIVENDRVFTFDPATAAFGFDPVAYGISKLEVVNAPATELPASGFNVIVLRTMDDDDDPATPFGPAAAADLIAGAIDGPGAGFFLYYDSEMNAPRLVYSTDLSVSTADLRVLARLSNYTGNPELLAQLRPVNFRILGDVVEVSEPSGLALVLGAAAVLIGASRRRR